MSDDEQTSEEKSSKVHKLPTELSEQTALTKKIQDVWCGLEADLCQQIRKAGLEMADILGNKHYI